MKFKEQAIASFCIAAEAIEQDPSKMFDTDDNGDKLYWCKYGVLRINPDYFTFLHVGGHILRVSRETKTLQYIFDYCDTEEQVDFIILDSIYSVCLRSFSEASIPNNTKAVKKTSKKLYTFMGDMLKTKEWTTY